MAAKKRKSDATRLDEVDRTLYSSFCSAANSLSQLYTHAMGHQKLSFQAGERHALEKLGHWILRQHEEDSRMTIDDILAHIQNELDYGGEDASVSPRPQFQQQPPQTQVLFTSPSTQNSYGLVGQVTTGLAPRVSQSDQAKDLVFSNTLSSPVHRGLQPCQLAQGEGCYPHGLLPNENGARNHESGVSVNNRESSNGFHDSSMDMHLSPTHGQFY